MAEYVIKRILIAVPTLIGVTIVVFLMIHLIPGNIVQVMLGTRTNVTPAQVRQLYALYGLNLPLWKQYLDWFGMIVSGNLGFSLRTGLPIAGLIGESVGVTAELAVFALLTAVAVAVPLGMLSALRRGTVWDFLGRGFSLLGLALPNFLLGTLLVLFAARYATGLSSFVWVPLWQHPLVNLKAMVLPILALALSLMAIITRMTRASMLETIDADFVRTARAKGLRETLVVLRHIFRNSLIPIVTIVGLQMGYLLGGAIVVENVFSLPGMGRLIVDAINQRDYPVVQASVLFVAAAFVMINLVVDIVYALLNPRIRLQ